MSDQLIKRNIKIIFDIFKNDLTHDQQIMLGLRNGFPKIKFKKTNEVDIKKFAKYIQKRYFRDD